MTGPSATTAFDHRSSSRRRARPARLAIGSLVLIVSFAAGCSSDDDGAASTDTVPAESSTSAATTTQEPLVAEELPPDDETFYDAPDPLPAGDHGDLVRYQLTGDQPEGLTRYRVMYLSETTASEPTVTTGLVSVPDGDVPADGWPVITYTRGSSGIADDCAISMAVDGTLDSNRVLAAEAWLLEDAVAEHRLVATITDYEGNGGPGIHPFLNGVSEGRAALDIVRAAGSLPGLELRDDVGIMGYSQGGHAALWTNQIAEEWAPELRVHGTVSGAPASEVLDLMAPDALWDQGSTALLAAGMAKDDPTLDLADLLTPEGIEFVDVMAETCSPDPAAVEDLVGAELLQARPDEAEPWRTVIESNIPGYHPAASPVLIIHGDADVNVPVDHSERLMARLCSSGVPTERRVVAGADHIAGAIPTIADGTIWLLGRIAGTEPEPTCTELG